MLSGAYTRKLDKSRRIHFPRSFLNEHDEKSLLITPGLGPYLIFLDKSRWALIEKSIDEQEASNPEATKRFRKLFISSAVEVMVSDGGRITLPKDLLEYANIKNEVILLGLFNRIELWDPEVFNNFVFKDEEEEIFLPKELLDAHGSDARRIFRLKRISYQKIR
jgi:MraZ protein